MTKVVNKYKEPYDVYIGRGSKWGNPYSHQSNTKAEYVVATREEAIAKYKEYLLNKPELLADIHELQGKTLGCFCKPKACHGDVLVELVNQLNPNMETKVEIKPMKTFNPMQYIAIDIANCWGLDKTNYEDRIQWVKTNIDRLEELTQDAEEPYLYYKAVRALRDSMNGIPTNHTVALDSASSGLQLMSVLMRDLDACITTGLGDNRIDAYTVVTDEMNRLMKEDGLEEVFVTRKQAKESCMTAAYGSVAIPKAVFGEDLLPYFYAALDNKFSGAVRLLEALKASWNSHADSHQWVMPDNHFVYIPVMEMKTTRHKVAELGYNMQFNCAFQQPKDKGISNIANCIHSIDSYVLRTLVRRCNYSKPMVEQFMAMSKNITYKPKDINLPGVQRYLDTKMADLSVLEHINHKNISYYPKEQIQALRAICETVLVHKPFEVICIHDSFSVSPVNCNYLRQHYNNILAELSDSDVLVDLLKQLYQTDDCENTAELIGGKIRNANYGIS